MPAFLLLSLLTALGCFGFVGALELTIGDGGTLTTFVRTVLAIAIVLGLNAGVFVLCRRLGHPFKRPLVVANTFLAAILLLFLQNKVMVGSQEIKADVVRSDGTSQVIAFRDLAGSPISAGSKEIAALKQRFAGGDFVDPIKVEGEMEVTPEYRIHLELAQDQDVGVFRERLLGKPFQRQNPERGLVEVPRGIDLRGGVEFICQLYDDLGQRVDADDEVLHILRSRLDQRGLTEPTVTRLSNGDVQIVIPGGTPADAARTRKVIEQTGRLEFREVLHVYVSEKAGELPPAVVRRPNGGYDLAPEFRANRRQVIAVDKSRDPAFVPTHFYQLGPAELTGKDVKTADRVLDTGRDAVSITFTATGGARNYEFTSRLYNDHKNLPESAPEKNLRQSGEKRGLLAILFDGQVESAPIVRSPSNNNCLINGSFTPEEIDSLRAALKGGSLAVTPVVLSERVVGATLGADAVNRSITTMLWCFVGILLFMGLYYRRLGVVAILCMLVTAALIWSTLSVFGAVLTLPGLAGLVLSIAMSMDTNVLVYERIREEQRDGKDLGTAIELGYGRAFLAILDSNLTTIFSGLILYWIGSGPVKGFGLTLAVGVAVSMFSGVYIGRMITELLCKGRDKVSMAGLIPQIRLPYVKWRKFSYALSFLTAVLGLGYFCFGHLLYERGSFNRNFDIDFTGGNLVQVIFTDKLSPDEVRADLRKAWDEHGETLDLLDPAELASPQAYFPTLAGGTDSRQWVFRGRDETGANREAERAELDQQRGELQREIDRARDPDHSDEAHARSLEPQVRELTEKIKKLEAGIQSRVQVFKDQIVSAFPGRVAPEGSEILAATWADHSLTLRVATLEKPDASQAQRISEILAKREELAKAEVTSMAEQAGLQVVVTYREKPTAAAVVTEDPIMIRLQSLLEPSAAAVTPAVSRVALDLYQSVVRAGAVARVTVAQSFPASQHFSGQVAGAMKTNALLALALATIAMLAYIAARFEFGFGMAAMIAMVHDVLLTLGLTVLLGLRIDLTVVAALLTVIGYSVNDTIVTFDRIRENLKRFPGKPLAQLIDDSIAQTMPRTILTGGATILAVVAMMLFAGEAIFAFNAVLLIGTILGTYSSVFVAAPLLLLYDKRHLQTPVAAEPVLALTDGADGGIEAPTSTPTA